MGSAQCVLRREAVGLAVVQHGVIERAGAAGGVVCIERLHEASIRRAQVRARAPRSVSAFVPGNTGGMKRPTAFASMME